MSILELFNRYSIKARTSVLEALLDEAAEHHGVVCISLDEIYINGNGDKIQPKSVVPDLLSEPILFYTDMKRNIVPKNLKAEEMNGETYILYPREK